MIRPFIFEDAALILFECQEYCAHGCCFALRQGAYGLHAEECNLFCDLFPWWTSACKRSWGEPSNHSAEQHEARILALLFCAEEAKYLEMQS